jgi:MFS family permease
LRGIGAAYRRVLTNRPLSMLLAGEFISSIGDWLYLVALLIIIYDTTQDAVVLGIVGAIRVLPYVFLSIPAGIAADRFDRRLILLVTDLCRGALMLVLAWLVSVHGSVVAIVALTTLATCFSAFFGPAIGSYIPALARDERDLGPANTIYSTLENVAFICGPALAAILIGLGGVVGAFLLNAVSFAVVAAILWRLPPSVANSSLEDAAKEVGAEEEAAAERVTDASHAPEPLVRSLAFPIGVLSVLDATEAFVFGGIGVLTVVIAFDQLDIGEAGTGLLNAAVGVGGLVGALIAGALVLRRRLAPPMLLGALVLAGSVAVLGISTSLPVALLAMGLSATGSLLVSIVATTLFQRIVPDAIRGRTLGVLETVSILAYALGALILPALVQPFGLDKVLVGAGVLMAVVGVVAIPLLGRHALQAPPEDAIRATLGEVPLFSAVPPARIETAERRATIVPMRPGQVIIRQGEQADRFYVIAEGTVEVTQVPPEGGEARILRTMGQAEVFGEIGLLTGVPRTATVTAASEGTLLALDEADFLELVGGGTGLTFPLLDVHRGVATTGG